MPLTGVCLGKCSVTGIALQAGEKGQNNATGKPNLAVWREGACFLLAELAAAGSMEEGAAWTWCTKARNPASSQPARACACSETVKRATGPGTKESGTGKEGSASHREQGDAGLLKESAQAKIGSFVHDGRTYDVRFRDASSASAVFRVAPLRGDFAVSGPDSVSEGAALPPAGVAADSETVPSRSRSSRT